MLFQRSESEQAVLRALERDSKRLTGAMLLDLLRAGVSSWKPLEYDAHQLTLRLRYEGRALAIHRAARKARYPSTSVRMPDAQFNWASLVSTVDAAVYDYAPERWLEDAKGERIADDDERARRFADLIRDAQLAVKLPELERRAMLSRTMLAQVTWLGAFDESNPRAGKPSVEMHWPNDVFVIPHHTRPTELATAVALISRRAGPAGFAATSGEAEGYLRDVGNGVQMDARTWWQVWTRPVEENEDGSIKRFGPWSVEHATLGGQSYLAFGSNDATYPLPHLPWAIYRVGMPQGGPFIDEDRDFPSILDALNVNWSNLIFVADMQGHDQVVVAGNTVNEAVVTTGPDVPVQLGPGQTASLLSPNPKLQDMRAINGELMRTLAVTRRQSADAYATTPGPPLTGVSRRIANEPQEKARRERSHFAVDFEEHQLLPILIEVAGYWGDYGIADHEGRTDLKPRMSPATPPQFEDPEVTQRRAIEAADAGWIEEERGAVEAGWYKSIDEAQDAMAKLEPKPKPIFGGFGGKPPAPGAPTDPAAKPSDPAATDEKKA